ncbi:MAG: TetR family transcriptional regulator C-terminal domain-containing protein [Planctomycetota bacterium]
MAKTKDPERTREALIDAACEEIRRKGFQAASLSEILAAAGMTKGALYHHFADKHALGYAVLEERLAEPVGREWVEPLSEAEDPIDALVGIIGRAVAALDDEAIALGDPLLALAAEMSALDEGFRTRINDVYMRWYQAIVLALVAGQDAGHVRSDVDAAATAIFIVGSLAGARTMAQHARSRELLGTCIDALLDYLETLRAQPG